MPKLLPVVVMNILAMILGLLALCAVPGAMLMVGLLFNLSEIPSAYRGEAFWQSVSVISGFVLLLSLSLWLFKRASTMARARKASLNGAASNFSSNPTP